jgi:hypothetical protein
MLFIFSIKLVKLKKVWPAQILGIEAFRDKGSNMEGVYNY